MPLSPYASRVQTVTELTRSIRGLLETEFSFVTVTGEVSNLRKPYSGHLYFTLKDREAQIKAVLFKGQQRYLTAPLEDGQQVICRGRISVYEPRGDYQIIADVVDPVGTGNLQIAFDRLKKELEAEGLFDSSVKRDLPFLPEKIFLITSPRGAALFDFLHIAENRFPAVPIEIFPVRVQGDEAAGEITRALEKINSLEEEGVIVLCRGGGSLEDLWAFNEEKVARAIYASELPVVSAIGHEVDFTIADFVADHRSATPTAAAKDILPDSETVKQHLTVLAERLALSVNRKIKTLRHQTLIEEHRLGDPTSLLDHFRLQLDNSQLSMAGAMAGILHKKKEMLRELTARLDRQDPAIKILHHRQMVADLNEKLILLTRINLERKRTEFEKGAALLDAVSPLSILARGYGIVRREKDGQIVRSANQVASGEKIRTKVHQGEIESRVTNVKE